MKRIILALSLAYSLGTIPAYAECADNAHVDAYVEAIDQCTEADLDYQALNHRLRLIAYGYIRQIEKPNPHWADGSGPLELTPKGMALVSEIVDTLNSNRVIDSTPLSTEAVASLLFSNDLYSYNPTAELIYLQQGALAAAIKPQSGLMSRVERTILNALSGLKVWNDNEFAIGHDLGYVGAGTALLISARALPIYAEMCGISSATVKKYMPGIALSGEAVFLAGVTALALGCIGKKATSLLTDRFMHIHYKKRLALLITIQATRALRAQQAPAITAQ